MYLYLTDLQDYKNQSINEIKVKSHAEATELITYWFENKIDKDYVYLLFNENYDMLEVDSFDAIDRFVLTHNIENILYNELNLINEIDKNDFYYYVFEFETYSDAIIYLHHLQKGL